MCPPEPTIKRGEIPRSRKRNRRRVGWSWGMKGEGKGAIKASTGRTRRRAFRSNAWVGYRSLEQYQVTVLVTLVRKRHGIDTH
jgi:hypothetical protein